MKLITVVVVIFMFAAPLMAETYTWEDETGTVNFTENYTSVPAKYRKKVRKLGGIGPDMSASLPAVVSTTKTTPAVRAISVASVSPEGRAAGLFGGRQAEAWQQEMRPLYADVGRLEQQLVELETLIRKPNGISKSRIDGLPQEFKAAQQLYKLALKKYNDMNDEANKVGLPADFRK